MVRKIFKSTMLVCAIVLTVGLAFVLGVLYRYFGDELSVELKKEAAYLSVGVQQEGADYLQKIKEKSSRITYIAEDGTVLYDSEADAAQMENHKNREEVQKAEKYGAGSAVRMSGTLSEKTIYYAVRLADHSVLRVSGTQSSVLTLLGKLLLPLFWILLLMLVLSGVIASKISKKLIKPINELDLEHPEENNVYEELSPLLSRIHKQSREIQKQIELARQQQEEFSIITENMQEGLIVIDRYTRILSANSSAWKLFREDKARSGESVYSLNRSEDFREAIENVLEGEHKEIVMKLNGSDIQLIANPVIRENKVEGAVLLLVNVTEKLERENLRREFSANVSHELKTPLTSISGFAEIIQDGYVQGDDVRKFAGRIYKEAGHLIQLVEDVIQISRLDEEQMPHEGEEVDVYQMCKGVCDALSEKAKKMNVHLYISGKQTMLCTVRTLLEEAIYNVCDNAIKYNKNDGSVSIFIKEDSSSKYVEIAVKDTGIGIPKEDQERIFERFYRVDKSHSKEISGTGLGLSIVKHAVTYLDGEIQLKSEEGMGTEIVLRFLKNHPENI